MKTPEQIAEEVIRVEPWDGSRGTSRIWSGGFYVSEPEHDDVTRTYADGLRRAVAAAIRAYAAQQKPEADHA